MKYFHLTTPQLNIWNLQKYYSGTAITNLCGAIFYQEKRNSVLLQQAIRQFVQNQSGLRLQFCEENVPMQYVSEETDENVPVKIFKSVEEFDCYAERFAKEPIGLIDCPMYRFIVFEIGNKSGILVVLSHLISDAWTFGLMANQIDAAYTKLSENAKLILTEADYADYISAEDTYLKSGRYAKDKSFWEDKYAACPEKSLIKLYTAPLASVKAKRITKVLPVSLEQKIKKYCKTYSVTQAVLFETAMLLYLSKVNPDNQAITIGVPVLNRSNAKEKSIAGMFVSTMPLTITVEEEMTVLELTGQITKGHMDIFKHQKYPYANILKFLREKQNFSGNLYEVMVSYQNAKTDTGADTKWYSNGYSEVPFVLHIDNRDENDSHTINVDYQVEVFKEEKEVEYIIERLEYILVQIVENSNKHIGDINIVPKKEKEKLICEFNDTYIEYPREKCIHELFTDQVNKTPERVALVFEDKKFTYRELDGMSNSLAHFLRESGVKPNDIVPIIARRSWHVIVAMLGVLKAGGAYLPVDPNYPEERIAYMLSETKADIVLTVGKELNESKIEIIDLEQFDYLCNVSSISNRNQATDLCYVLFTSGSTGKPKAAMIRHTNLGNFVDNNSYNKHQYAMVNTCKYVLADGTFTFDISAFEIYLAILHGLTLILTKEMADASYLAELIIEHDVDVLHVTPTKILMLLQNEKFQTAVSKVKLLMIGAEAFSQELYQVVSSYTDAVIYNGYGPTEATAACSFKRIQENVDITIGKPIANTQIYILDKDSNPVPIGVAGELCIAGAGVGKGYLNRPELTAEKFVPNPFATEENHHGKIMYHTGDLARWRVDGEIEYLGRIDTQVKMRGLRIELGEIESVMSSFEGIRFTAVADKRDENNRQYLVGYYTADENFTIDEKKLRQYLTAKLPKYMVPNYFMRLEKMPMTSSGKTDRKNLPAPDFTVQVNEYIAPVTGTEKKLAVIWQELFQIDKVGKTDDFFELGGDSLMAISMVNKAAMEFHVEIGVKDVMEHSALEQLALCIEKAGEALEIFAEGKKSYALLPQQKAIYAACSKEPDALTYNMPAEFILPEDIDIERLKQSICKMVNHHKLLKSCIRMKAEEIMGIYDDNAELVFEEYGTDEREKFIRPFDLSIAPLVRVGFMKNRMLFDIHHIVADGASINIIMRDIVSSYEGMDLSDVKASYADYSRFFYEQDMGKHKIFFIDMLKGDFEPVMLPETKKPEQSGRSKFYQISGEIVSRARDYAKRRNLTDTMVFLGVYGIMLSKYTSQKNILSSIVLQNRIHADTKNMVGMFVNTLPIQLDVSGSIDDYMQKIRHLVLNLFEYQELPLSMIEDLVGMDKNVINTSFVYQADGEKKLNLDGRELVPRFLDTHTSKFDLTMEITPLTQGMKIRMEYNCEKYDEVLMDRLAEAYIRILLQLDRENIEDIIAMPEEEYHKVLEQFNDTYIEYPREKCIHELFTEQVNKTPERVALVFEDKKFTYRELDEMSNSLAHFLREKGVKPNDVVPIIAKRSWHVIVAMLGVLKAGGAYLPVDPNYPEERIAYMLSETKADIVLTVGKELNESKIKIIDLEQFDYLCNVSSISNRNQATDLCYVLFTSGSTGKPKAAMIRHTNLGNFVDNNSYNKYRYAMVNTCKYVLANTTFTFDISVFEIYLTLLNGLTLILTREMADTSYLAGLIIKYDVDVIHATPTKIFMLLQNEKFREAIAKVKLLMIGAETFSQELHRVISSYTDAIIYNGYGPTETTIGCSFKRIQGSRLSIRELKEPVDITIGKPIANTQIYILDKDSNPVPIGVAGELCIAGAGVGKGYLNRPELTAEKFVPNPFATEENHHGKIMYHTGDLACWRADGEIEYLGRIDTQVKIRGLRIELGEIESVMSSFEGIQFTAVADKRDENNRQYLVGYYTADENFTIDEKKLRQYLATKLPKYMVPNYFMRLEKLPMTPSGKTDRKNLPVPDFTVQVNEYIEPETEQEEKLCRLMEKLLHAEKIGVDDDFFELGGDSLSAIEYVAKAHSLGIDFALQNVFDYPTVRQLCNFLNDGVEEKVQYAAADFDKYQCIFEQNVINEQFVPEKRSLGNVLLTGATGFLGAHILDQLMKEDTGKIYCLIRSSKAQDRRGRLHEILSYYFGDKYNEEIGRRIIPVIGDIELKGLAEQMPSDVQTVIHAAASVKHYGSYAYFHKVNVEGTQHVIDYAKSVGAKLIHISTLSVSGNSMADDFTVYRSEQEKFFYETSFYIEQPLDNVYIHSKFEAEKRVYDAMLGGMDAKVIRVGNLTNRASDFKFQPNYKENAFLTRVKAILEFGLFPDYLVELYSEFSPIDLTAQGIVKIAQYADKQTVFHLNSNRVIYFERFLEIVHELGISMKVVDGVTFNKELQKTIRNTGTEYIFEALQNDMDEQGRLVYDSNIRIKNEFTLWFLEKAGFAWNETDLDYIKGYIGYFRSIGYLEV